METSGRTWNRHLLPGLILLPAFSVALMIVGCAQTPRRHYDLIIDAPDAVAAGHSVAPSGQAEVTPPPRFGQDDLILLASAEGPRSSPRSSRTPDQATDTSDAFRFTTIRGWLYRNYVPDESDPWIFGIETNSVWGWGDFDVANISYIEIADYPEPIPGMPAGNPEESGNGGTGLTDLLTTFLFSRKGAHHGPHHFALGIAAQFPTATDDTLGSGKWCIGPSVEYEYHSGKFYAAFVALNVFSVAGDSDRKDVNMLMIKPMITYEVFDHWKAVYMPYGISVYWNKPTEDAVYLPIGAAIQHDFELGTQRMAASLGFYEYVIRPDDGAKYDLRFMIEFDF